MTTYKMGIDPYGPEEYNGPTSRSILDSAAREMKKCKDPVYFYENYFLVDGKKPKPLTEFQKDWIRKLASGTDLDAEMIKNLGK